MLDPILIEPAAFTAEGQKIEGELPLTSLDDRVKAHEYFTGDDVVFSFILKGSIDKWQRPVLDLRVAAEAGLTCQRCLQPVPHRFDEHSRITLFTTEAALDEAMLADDELEGMLLTPELDVRTLVEDQILMALPYSPRHESCENGQMAAVNQDKPNPFAVLAGLKK